MAIDFGRLTLYCLRRRIHQICATEDKLLGAQQPRIQLMVSLFAYVTYGICFLTASAS